jgi:hypothetical protein
MRLTGRMQLKAVCDGTFRPCIQPLELSELPFGSFMALFIFFYLASLYDDDLGI